MDVHAHLDKLNQELGLLMPEGVTIRFMPLIARDGFELIVAMQNYTKEIVPGTEYATLGSPEAWVSFVEKLVNRHLEALRNQLLAVAAHIDAVR